jgi:hypothetical protein
MMKNICEVVPVPDWHSRAAENGSGLSLEEVKERLRDAVGLKFGNTTIAVERKRVEEAIEIVMDDDPDSSHIRATRADLIKQLNKFEKRVKRGKDTVADRDLFVANLCFLHALDRFEANQWVIAGELFAYMTWRADQEGIEHRLSYEFYRAGLAKGCRNFFGIQVDTAGIIGDEQQPALFARYRNHTMA